MRPRSGLQPLIRAAILAALFNLPNPSPAQDAPPPSSPLTPRREAATFTLADPNLSIELLVSEPSIMSPVDIAWDEHGRLYVAEMTDYPTGPPSGRIRLLDGYRPPGQFDRVTTFAEGLAFPNSVLPHRGGLLVTAAPDILFLKDNDGDGVADERQVILTGFGEGNQQLRVNGLYSALDNWIYGANGRSSGTLRPPDAPPEKAIPLGMSDFRFRPDTGQCETVAGFSQFGLASDDHGNRFPSWNTVPLRHVVLEKADQARNPYLPGLPAVAEILPPGDVAVYPLSQPPRTFNRESVRAFNASCGTTINRGNLLGPAYAGNAFIGEPLTNLVHRRVLQNDGVSFQALRAETSQEFLAATDPWFHPVQFANGPDGALYVVDFYREWVEHPDFVPPADRPTVNWRNGWDHGRIWRIAPKNAPKNAPWPRLQRDNPTPLIAALNHPNGWIRDTAQRLLVEEGGSRAVPGLQAAARNAPTPLGRIHALWTLDGLHASSPDLLATALKDPDPTVREQALRIARQHPDLAPALAEDFPPLADDPSIRVRFQTALTLSGTRPEDVNALGRMLRTDAADPWLRAAILTAAAEHALPLTRAFLGTDTPATIADDPAATSILESLATIAGARGDTTELAGFVHLATPPDNQPLAAAHLSLLLGLSQGMRQRGTPLEQFLAAPPAELAPTATTFAKHLATLQPIALDDTNPPPQRILALNLLAEAHPSTSSPLALNLLAQPQSPDDLQQAAAQALARSRTSDTAAPVLDLWETLRIPIRRAILASFARSPALAPILVDGLERGIIPPAELDPSLRVALTQLRDPQLQTRLESLLGPVQTDRAEVVLRYTHEIAALEQAGTPGNPQAGASLFATHCLTCHSLQGKGQPVGPSLAGVGGRPTPSLIDDILNPSREVSPDYRGFVLHDRQGLVSTGLLVSDNPTGITLRGPGGIEVTTPRHALEALHITDKSLMPEGLETQLTPPQLRDLITFLRRSDHLPLP